MEDLTDYSSEIVEFKPTTSNEKEQLQLIDKSCQAVISSKKKDEASETQRKATSGSQTDFPATATCQVDDEKLARWLNRIYPLVEAELAKGQTPPLDFCGTYAQPGTLVAHLKIQIYQKIAVNAVENSQGLSIWLSVHTNDAPVLVVTTIAPHEAWCEHINQSLKIFVPKRMPNSGNFVIFTEVQSVPLKSCLRVLCTNSYDKNIFSGATVDGDLYVWEYRQRYAGGPMEVRELFHITSPYAAVTAMHWGSKNRLLTTYANGWIFEWNVAKQMIIDMEFYLTPTPNTGNDICAIICLSINEFVVATKDGGVYYCWRPLIGSALAKKKIDITPLRRHAFTVMTLRKIQKDAYIAIISCDLSGQLFYHDLRHSNDEEHNVIVQIPLPFKNALEFSRGADIIFSPGDDGSLECYRIRDGEHSIVKGALRGKGNMIKCSKNGCWIVTGLYTNEFQIFYVDKENN